MWHHSKCHVRGQQSWLGGWTIEWKGTYHAASDSLDLNKSSGPRLWSLCSQVSSSAVTAGAECKHLFIRPGLRPAAFLPFKQIQHTGSQLQQALNGRTTVRDLVVMLHSFLVLITAIKLNPIFKQGKWTIRSVALEQQSLIPVYGSYFCVLFKILQSQTVNWTSTLKAM